MRKLTLIVCLIALGSASMVVAAPAALRNTEPSTEAKAPFDRAFIDAMVPHHRSAMAMAREAKRLGLGEPILLNVANDILKSQASEIAKMLRWRKAWYGSTKLDPDAGEDLGLSEKEMGMSHKPSELRKAKDLDKAFAQMMIPHHRGAITMANLALQRATHPEIKTLARQITTAQQREIRLMTPFASGGGHHG